MTRSPRWLSLLAFLLACGGGSTSGRPDAGNPELVDSAGPSGEDAIDDEYVEVESHPSAGDVAGEAGPGDFGWPCQSNADCASGYCVEGKDGPVCTMTCLEECPPDWACRATVVGSDVISLCMPTGVNLCRPCKVDTQCGDGLCIEVGNGRYCGRDCSDADCPAGYDCREVAVAPDRATKKQCVPKSGACDCNVTTAGAQRPCARKNDVGTCLGFETCDPGTGWTCDAADAKPEECNGKDDDCNGVADDNPVPPAPECTITEPGVGSCKGHPVCNGTDGWGCAGPKPSPETCNYLDDDCDGETDEDFRDGGAKYVDLHHCGACGADCTGKVPFATATACDVSGDAPACVATACMTGYSLSQGTGRCLPQVSNLCAPCTQDADCGPVGDRCLELADGKFCGQDCSAGSIHGTGCPSGYACESQGQCVPVSGSCTCTVTNAGLKRACAKTNEAGTCIGSETCDPALGWFGCNAETPAPETCNGLDDNCNALTDEGFPEKDAICFSGLGACRAAGKIICTPDGKGVVCDAKAGMPKGETCDGTDDDCDGETDEDWPDKGTVCTSGVGACQRIGTFVCRPDHGGLECDAAQGQPVAETCDYLDNDCDGKTDEDFLVNGKYGSDKACGNCFTDCTAIWVSAVHHARGICDLSGQAPKCRFACDGGWADADGNPENGCEMEIDALAVYVSTPENGGTNIADCGAWNLPCASIAKGISVASATQKIRVRVSEGLFAENLVLSAGISVLGGHNAVNWNHDPKKNLTFLQGSTPDPGTAKHRKAITAKGITTDTELSGFTIFGEHNFYYKAGDSGGNSYAIHIQDCGPKLVIHDNVIYAGRGSAGADGANGVLGANGANGSPGNTCIHAGSYYCSGITNPGGSGGSTTCGVAGGTGGKAICPSGHNQMPSGNKGAGTAGGAGGAGGWSDTVSDACSLCNTAGKTDFGYDGGAGGSGASGAAGAACVISSVNFGEWTPGLGTAGGDGGNGSGGGGGGAGGGVDFNSGACGYYDRLGSTGGGGGSGGCGGKGGGPGLGGGASIAVFVFRTGSGPAGGPTIQNNVIVRNQGGAGGQGGSGGTGGVGGSGGIGGDIDCGEYWFKPCVGHGGTGGDGGNGGNGGGGGGGCGGASYGILTSGLSGANYCKAGNQFSKMGDGGPGGQGGNSAGNPGKTGSAGEGKDCRVD